MSFNWSAREDNVWLSANKRTPNMSLQTWGAEIMQVQKFKYFGRVFTDGRKYDTEIPKCIGKRNDEFQNLSKVLWNRKISLETYHGVAIDLVFFFFICFPTKVFCFSASCLTFGMLFSLVQCVSGSRCCIFHPLFKRFCRYLNSYNTLTNFLFATPHVGFRRKKVLSVN